jgi:Alpha/beta hydrolase family
MLALIQKLIAMALLAAACGWLLYFGHAGAPIMAVAGFFLIAFGYIFVLALEFALLHVVSKTDPAPRATPAELLNAWFGETRSALAVFGWRQPFRSRQVPDQFEPAAHYQGWRGVVFVHGFFCNRGFWAPWLARLQGGSHAFVALSLEPIFGSIDDYAGQIDEAVQRVTRATGLPPVLVCHSMGGLAVRAWLSIHRTDARVCRVVTIGTPHRGTWLARFGHGQNNRQMRLLSDWHARLDLDMPEDRYARFICWYSNCDNIVFPTSTATMPSADNRLVKGAAHVQLAFDSEVITETLKLLKYEGLSA